MKLRSHALLFKDFNTSWYKKWSVDLKQDNSHLDGHKLKANKFWQNAAICQALFERHKIKPGLRGIGFGVGQERVPALLAKYGVEVTATDQDYTAEKASHWSEHELAKGQQSLNKLDISPPDELSRLVTYMAVDMTNIPQELTEKYDFLWSNCSLGHLGSITGGLNFIIDSLKCLKPGGVAAHTTEVNTISDSRTLATGDTVIFRLRDLLLLSKTLINKGYKVSLLKFDLGKTGDDFRISMQPKFGNDYSKIQVGGFISTQVVLIISKPKKSTSNRYRKLHLKYASLNYKANLLRMRQFRKNCPDIQQLIKSQNALPEAIVIKPIKSKVNIKVKAGQKVEVYIEYINKSQCNLYGYYGHPIDVAPIALATSNPKDRKSIFTDDNWISYNRGSSDLFTNETHIPLDCVKEGQIFTFKLIISANKVKRGIYQENFSVLQENLIWVNDSEVALEVDVY